MKNRLAVLLSLSFTSLIGSSNANADWTMRFTDADFGQNPVFNEITEFEFEFVIAGDLQRGTYVNPPLVSVNYTVFGDLPQGSTSGYPFFTLVRAIDGQEFYDQGSSISFEILPSANLFDGLRIRVSTTFIGLKKVHQFLTVVVVVRVIEQVLSCTWTLQTDIHKIANTGIRTV